MVTPIRATNWGPAVISTLVVMLFSAVVVLLMVKPIKFDDAVEKILTLLLGTLSAKFGDVIAYHINSTAGSKAKDSTIANAVTSLADSVPASTVTTMTKTERP